GAATWFVVSVGGEETKSPATQEPAPPPLGEESARDALQKRAVGVLNATTVPGLGGAVRDFLGADRVAYVGNSPSVGIRETFVAHAFRHKREAQRVAELLGWPPVRGMTRDVRQAAGGAAVVVVVGSDIRGSKIVPLRDLDTNRRVGTVSVLDRAGRDDLVALEARTEGDGYPGVWLAEPGATTSGRFLGFAQPPGRDGTIEVRFPAPDAIDRRLLVSRERGAEVGSKPREPLLVADL
ncbi:MAG TPA: LytR C-terminal domain-containing protein, partial [Solirubrobacteraceae bacterium]